MNMEFIDDMLNPYNRYQIFRRLFLRNDIFARRDVRKMIFKEKLYSWAFYRWILSKINDFLTKLMHKIN